MKVSEVAQPCLTICDPMDCSLPGSSVHGIFQARLLEWVAIAFSLILYNGQLKGPWRWRHGEGIVESKNLMVICNHQV